MDRVPAPPAGVASPPVFVDGFGARYQTFDPESGDPDDPVEVLCFSPALVDLPEFAATLGVRVARLANVRHTLFAGVRRLDRPTEDSLLLVSDRVEGWRLADVLDVMERENLSFDISAILSLLRQLMPTVSLFARHQRELAVGTIGPEHLILTPQGRLVVAEYVLGSAIEKLSLSRDELWRTYRVAATAGVTRIWTRSDALGIGVVVLSLLLGRRLRDDEFPASLPALLDGLQETSGGIVRPLSPRFAAWLGRALQLDSRTAFQSPQDAQVAFEEMLASERHYVTTPALLDAFLAQFQAVTAPPPEPGPAPEDCTPAPADAAVMAAEEAPIPVTFDSVPQYAQPEAVAPGPSKVRLRIGRVNLGSWSTTALVVLGVALFIESLVLIWMWNASSEALVRSGELVVQSRPPGARVTLDDKDLGTTPVTVRLSPGTYTLKVQAGADEPRVIPVQIRAGVQTVQYLELHSGR